MMKNVPSTQAAAGRHPFFSVVVPVHNKALHIRRALSSVVSQSFGDFEIIIIDDASTDASREEMTVFCDNRMRFFQRSVPGPGGYAARNLGIRESRAAWVAFLDADDEWHSRHLERVFEGIRQFPDAGMVSSGWMISGEGANKYDAYYVINRARGAHLYDMMTYIHGPRPIWTSVAVVRKELLRDAGGFDERWRHGADTELWLRLLLQNIRGLWIPGPGATYYRDAENRVTADLHQFVAPSAITIKNYLKAAPRLPGDFILDLKVYANKISMRPFRRKILHADIRIRDITGTFFFGVLPLKRKLLLILLCLLPMGIRKKLAQQIIKQLA